MLYCFARINYKECNFEQYHLTWHQEDACDLDVIIYNNIISFCLVQGKLK